MTRKHFDALAETFKGIKPADARISASTFAAMGTWTAMVEASADVCARFNPNFDRARFLKACGVEEAAAKGGDK